MAVEELGRWEDPGPDDGPRRRHLSRDGEETKEKTPRRLSPRESQAPQLVGLPLLLLRSPRPRQRGR